MRIVSVSVSLLGCLVKMYLLSRYNWHYNQCCCAVEATRMETCVLLTTEFNIMADCPVEG